MEPPDRRRRAAGPAPAAARGGAARWCVGLVLLLVTAGACVLLASGQQDSRRELEVRFAARGALAANFFTAYSSQLLERERSVAQATLGGSTPQGPFDSLVAAFGFQAAVLLDDGGRILAISPAKPQLIGTEIASRYPHLAAAVAGSPAVSPVVPSAAEGESVVGFAAPFDTPTGRRVLSGAFALQDTPLQAYLDGFSSLPGYRALILDGNGTVITATRGTPAVVALRQDSPELAAALVRQSVGTVERPAGPDYFAAHDVAGTPWRLVTVMPVATLLEPISGASRVLPWVILGGLVVAASLSFGLGLRLLEGRRQLQLANTRLDDLAGTDSLTGVANRRRIAQLLEQVRDRCEQAEIPLSVLVLDVDHFKRVNDTFGHASGDEVLREVAGRLGRALRDDDALGRWGGEEFLVVLPMTPLSEGQVVAERLRQAIADAPFAIGSGGDEIDVTVSVGVASSTRMSSEVLVHQADRALYAAKAAGRNVVIASSR